ncbi:MAG: hypothetical protein QXG01_07305 [Candidatus Bathyarchaeia archaeon]
MKYVGIGIALAILAIGALFVIAYTINRSQTDKAFQLLEKISKETGTVNVTWIKIESNLAELRGINRRIIKIDYETSSQRQEINLCMRCLKTAFSIIADVKNDLDSIEAHDENITKSLQELRGPNLPNWFYDYKDLRASILEKDLEKVSKAREILDNMDLHFKFSKGFFEGMVVQLEMEEALEYGMDNFVMKEYSKAREQLEKALEFNSKFKAYIGDIAKLITFDYFDRIESNSGKLKEIIEKLIRACDLVKEGSYAEAKKLYEEAYGEYSSLERLNMGDLMSKNQEWWKKNVESIYADLKELTREIEDLEHRAASLIEKYK